MKKHDWYHSIWEFELRDKNGKLIDKWSQRNALVDQGENNILDSYFRGLNAPIEFYLRLCNDTLDEGDQLNTIVGEPTANGYAAQLIERSDVGFPTIELHEGDYRIISKQVTFTATGGDIGPVNTGYLATTSTNLGKLIAFVNFDVPRTILNGSSLLAKFQVKLQ